MVRQLIHSSRARTALCIGTLLGTATLLGGCNDSQLGFQGGVVPQQFSGITSAMAISPQSIQLSWNGYPGATKYKVYISDKNEAIFEPGFTSIIFQPIPLDPARTYQYSVTAVDPNTGLETGNRTAYVPVQLLPHFNFLQSGSIVPASKTSVRVNWLGNPGVTYKVFVAERLPTGAVNYNNFISSTQNVVSGSSASITGLQEGHEYCAIVVAAYSDQTNDGPDGTTFNTTISTTLSSPAWMVGPSGTFGDSKIGLSQKCVRTQSDFSIANMRVYAPKATLASKPTFYVDVPGDTVEDNTGIVETSIYQVNPGGLATMIGKRTGTGRITATSAIPAGRYKFFAVITDLQGTAHAMDRKEVIVGANGTLPADDTQRQWVYVRSFDQNEDPTAPTGYYPSKQQAGYGSQRTASSVAMGDFNCDGKTDLAIGVPDATVMAADNRPAKQGKVVIYYDVSNGTPNTTGRMQTITFDITPYAGDPGRDLRLGTSLYSVNINKDNQLTNQYGSASGGQQAAFQCDDLVIGSGYGPMFVIYGKRDISGPNGGLNYANATSYTVNPSSSCDPSTNVCEPAMYSGNSYTIQVGRSITAGDFNGDGYPDLVATTAAGGTGRGTMVFRGSEFGLIPPASYSDTFETVSFASGPYPSFPYLPYNTAGFAAPSPTPKPGWNDPSIGSSAAPFYNAYYDPQTQRVRDILLVGAPSYVNGLTTGRVIACKPVTATTSGATFSSDANLGLYWDCSKAIDPPSKDNGLTFLGGSFGAAMTAVRNPLRYQPNQFKDPACAFGDPNCSSTSVKLGYPGAVAIGAPIAQAVYVYYLPANPGAATTRNGLGTIRNTIVNKLFSQTRNDGTADLTKTCSYSSGTTWLCVESNNPCKTVSSGIEYCDVQQLTHPTSGSGQFGSVLATLAGNNPADTLQAKDSILAVAAPFKSISVSGGITYSNVGSVQLYLQNSNFSSNPIIVKPGSTNNCSNDTDGYCRFSDGFSNTLTTSVDYDGTLNDNINFGLGGMASGSLEADPLGSAYNNSNDIVVGAPGHIAHVTAGGTSVNIYDNGAALVYFSHGGTYRTYRTVDTGPGPSPWHLIDRSFSQESDVKFHLASSIGDINLDGVDDVAVRINSGSRNRTRIYYGRSDRVGFSTAANTYQDIDVQGDLSAGMRVVPLGKITNGQFPAFLFTSTKGSYIYFAGINGLIQGAPSAFGLGGTPRKMFAPQGSYYDSSFLGYISYIDFSDNYFPNTEQVGNIDSTLYSLQSFAHGDFNGDGYEDVAMTVGWLQSVADLSKSKGCTGNYCLTPATGGTAKRVLVFYGGNDNGFQIQPDANGGYPLNSQYIADYSIDRGGSTFASTGPCNTAGKSCKIQMLTEGTGTIALNTYGDSLVSVPLGNCVVNGANVPVHGLAVQGNNGTNTKIYLYKPKCLGSSNDLSGLTSYPNDRFLTIPAASATSSTMGLSMSAATNLMGPAGTTVSHLIVTDRNKMTVYAYPVFSFNPVNGVNFGVVTDTANGGRTIDYTTSSMMTGQNGSTAYFGTGVSDIGDVNGDGFSDVAIGMSKLDRKDVSSLTSTQGAILVLFGSPNGLQSHASGGFTSVLDPIRDAFCYTQPSGSTINSVCNPTLLYLPEPTNSVRNGAYERTYLGRASRLNFGNVNENLGSFLIGIPGRDSLEDATNQRTLNGGAFYVLP